ncbi:unnamed protein product [Lactuca virosa]|uniref:Uncharacterized protein n=1 Tax=Lactuca virosa TaxID=75947 RepID=A0AAU9NJY4_9ASTR|nr:unnamed protein product [Lactuca virosa]
MIFQHSHHLSILSSHGVGIPFRRFLRSVAHCLTLGYNLTLIREFWYVMIMASRAILRQRRLLLPNYLYHVSEALKRKINARIEFAKFLQDTVKEMAKEIQNSRSGEVKKTAEDLDEFLSKARV